MRLINKTEFEYLIKRGCKVGDHVHVTHSNRHKYYATESPKVLKLLEELHSEKVC